MNSEKEYPVNEYHLSLFQRELPLFLDKKNRKPEYSGLNYENILKTYIWLIEIQNWQNFDPPESPLLKKNVITVYHKFRQGNENFNSKELLQFQAGVTKFKNDPDFWKHNYNNLDVFQKDEKVLIKAIYQIYKNELNKRLEDDFINKTKKQKNSKSLKSIQNIESLIYNGDAKTFNLGKNVLLSEIEEDRGFDKRASNELMQNIWYMEKMDFQPEHQNFVFDFIQETELLYRSEERKREDNRHNTDLKELSFNHLMRVQRIAWSLIDKAIQKENFAKFSQTEQAEIYNLRSNPHEMLKLSLIALGHDLLEDNKFNSEKEFKNFILKLAKQYLPHGESREISDEVTESISRLNSHNYLNEEGQRSPENYINGNPAKNIRPLNFIEKIVKIADISHNYQSSIKITGKEDKIKAYANFVDQNIHLLALLPTRIIRNFFYQEAKSNNPAKEKHNQELLKFSGWQKCHEML